MVSPGTKAAENSAFGCSGFQDLVMLDLAVKALIFGLILFR